MKDDPSKETMQSNGGIIATVCRIGAAAGLVLCLASAAAAQPPATNGTQTTTELALQLQTRLAEARAELEHLQTAQTSAAGLPPGATTVEAEELHLLSESVVRTYQEHLDQLARLEEARRQQVDIEQTITAWPGFSEPAPYSILLVDELRDSIQSLAAKLSASETAQNVLATFAEDVESALKASDERLRLLTEQLETAKEPNRVMRLTWERSLEQFRNRQAMAATALTETRRRRVETELAGRRQQLAFVKRQLALAARHVRFPQTDLDKVLASLKMEQDKVEQEIAEAEKEVETRQRELAEAREALRRILVTPDRAEGAPAASGSKSRQFQTQIELRAAQTETSSQRLVVLRHLADALVNERGLWRMRFASFHTQDLDKLRAGYQRLDQMVRLVHSVKPHFLQQIDLAAQLIAEQSNRIQNRSDGDPDAAQALLETYRQREAFAHLALRGLERLERLTESWKASLDEDRRQLPLTGRLRDLFGGFSSFAAKLWHFELFDAEDTITVDGQTITGRRSVTVGKIVMAVFILAVGYWLALLLSRLLESLAVKRLKIEPNQAKLIRRWVRVVLMCALVVFSLVSVKIPLTVFAFLGGALAIGLGFGTQNLLKNFISGIIILFERPFRVGDVLDIGGHRGTVIGIGIRSSVLRLFDSTETLIPNSALLENNLTNWTYSDHKVRFAVAVGVAYGSDTRRVAQILADVAERHGLVQKEPVPQILFMDFADNTLNFELRFWVDVLRHNAVQISSDLRHMIAGEFAANGISIAFPQRDIHLDCVRPLQVQIVPPTETGETGKKSSESIDG